MTMRDDKDPARPQVDSADDQIFSSELGARAGRALESMLRTLLLVLPVLLVFTFLHSTVAENLAVAGLLAVVCMLYLLQKSGRMAATLYSLVAALIVYGVLGIVAYGSIRSIASLAFVGAVVIGGIFLGRGALIATVVASAVALAGLIYAESSGWLRQPDYAVGITHWIVHVAVIGAVAINLFFARSLMLDALQIARREQAELRQAKQVQLESDARHLLLFNKSPVAQSVIDAATHRYISVNPAWENLTGLTAQEVVGQDSRTVHIYDREWRKTIGEKLEHSGYLDREYAVLHRKDGGLRHVRLSGGSVTLLDRRMNLWWALDMTAEHDAQERAEEMNRALRVSEEQFYSIFRLSPVAMAITRVADGRYLEVNDAGLGMLGYAREELLARTTSGSGVWLSTEAREAFVARLRAEGRVDDYATQMRNSAGEVVDCLLSASRMTFNGEACVLSATRNVTEQKREEALILDIARGVSGETGAPFFCSLVEHLGKAVNGDTVLVGEIVDGDRVRTLAVLRDGKIVPNIEYALESTPCEIVSKKGGLTVYQDGVANLFPRDTALQREGIRGYAGIALRDADRTTIGVLNVLCRNTLPHTERMEALFRIFAARAQAELLRMRREREILALNQNLEQRVLERTRALESANADLTLTLDQLHSARDAIVRAERLASLGALVAGVAHELNTPIGNSLLAASTLAHSSEVFSGNIASGLKRSDLARFTDDMTTANDLLLRNLRKASELIASFKQVAVDQTSSWRRTFELAEVIHEIAMTLGPSFKQSPIALSIEVAPGISMDSFPGPLGQIVGNLVHNALLHAFEGRVTGTIEIRGTSTEPGWVELLVTDDGIGIPEQNIGRIFDPFFTTRLGKGGSGLGLNIVYNLVNHVLGGSISVTSGGGSTIFRMRVPQHAPKLTEETALADGIGDAGLGFVPAPRRSGGRG